MRSNFLNANTTPKGVKPLKSMRLGWSLNEPSMSDQEGSSVVTADEPTSIASMPWMRVFQGLDMESLSPRSQSISLLIGEDLVEGYRPNEIAEKLGRPSSWVAERLEELKAEIALDTGHFLPLSYNEFESLTESIKEFGVHSPVLIGEHQLIDGRHRWIISHTLGLKEIPAVFIMGLTAEQEHDIGVAVNSARRHLNRKQKQMIIRGELKRDWSRPSRQIAAICGVSAPTVEVVREEMRREAAAAEVAPQEETDEPQQPTERVFVPPAKELDMRVDKRGRVQPAYVPERNPAPVTEKFLGYATCGHGQMHELYLSGSDQYILKAERD